MGITETGKKVLKTYRKKFGNNAEEMFFKSIKKFIPGSANWFKKKKKQKSKYTSSLKPMPKIKAEYRSRIGNQGNFPGGRDEGWTQRAYQSSKR